MTKIVRLHAFGGPENLKIDEAASLKPGAGEALLRIEAAGINRDHYTFMSGHQFSGHVTNFKIGELAAIGCIVDSCQERSEERR